MIFISFFLYSLNLFTFKQFSHQIAYKERLDFEKKESFVIL